MTELEKMRKDFPDAKALVFSQFSQSLAMIKSRLVEVDIFYV
jgi:SNF2 family DNA or RNA helicase